MKIVNRKITEQEGAEALAALTKAAPNAARKLPCERRTNISRAARPELIQRSARAGARPVSGAGPDSMTSSTFLSSIHWAKVSGNSPLALQSNPFAESTSAPSGLFTIMSRQTSSPAIVRLRYKEPVSAGSS